MKSGEKSGGGVHMQRLDAIIVIIAKVDVNDDVVEKDVVVVCCFLPLLSVVDVDVDFCDGWEGREGEKSGGGVHMQRLDAIHKQFITFHRRSLKAVMMMMI